MVRVKLVIEASDGSVLAESSEFKIDENWKDNSDLVSEVSRLNKLAKNMTMRWRAHGEGHVARVGVDVIQHVGSLVVPTQLESFVEKEANQS